MLDVKCYWEDEAKEKDKGLQFQTGWSQKALLGFSKKSFKKVREKSIPLHQGISQREVPKAGMCLTCWEATERQVWLEREHSETAVSRATVRGAQKSVHIDV